MYSEITFETVPLTLFAAVVGSAGLPIMCILFGDVLQAFVDYDTFGSCNLTSASASDTSGSLFSAEEVPFSPQASVNRFGWGMCVIGFATWLGNNLFQINWEILQEILKKNKVII